MGRGVDVDKKDKDMVGKNDEIRTARGHSWKEMYSGERGIWAACRNM
jgi:hypothetical protein